MRIVSHLLSVWVLSAWTTAGLAHAEDPNAADRAMDQSLLWGPYRPNLYFGVRPRIPESLLMGLIWAKVDDYRTTQSNFRHTCEQNEGMEGYGWEEYDIRKGGRQTIHDSGNHLDLTIDFIKVPGGEHGGNWGARIKGALRPGAEKNQSNTVIFYIAAEGSSELALENEADPLGYKGDVTLAGNSQGLGKFKIGVTSGPETNVHPPRTTHPSYDDKPLDRTIISSLHLEPHVLWQAKTILFTTMKSAIDFVMQKHGENNPPPPAQLFTLPNIQHENPNAHFIQKVFEGEFEFDVLFSSESSKEPITSSILSKEIIAVSNSFSQKFQNILQPLSPFTSPEYLRFSKEMLSNLVGGIGYFYGDSIIDRSNAPEYEEEEEGFWDAAAEARSRANPGPSSPQELFTAIPSRPFFPRGFLWDEGFHLLPIVKWDSDLTLQILKSWFNLMDDDGWIAREQILGPEARSKVPSEFQVQYPHYANPPTLYFVLLEFLHNINEAKTPHSEDPNAQYTEHADLTQSYLRSIYPLLKRQYFWFRKTQWGDIKSYDREAFSSKEAYRWRGRTVEHILTSGLDDYPRPQPPHPGELHVDLISWMGMMTKSLRLIAEAIDEKEDVEELAKYEQAIRRNIEDLHWDNEAKTYCDATIDEFEESVHVCHKGYISIFPFLTGLMDANHPKLGHVLELINDPDQLWSDYGIRSLSKSDKFYGTGENYWKGPVWVNINYLVLKNLLIIAREAGPHQDLSRDMYIRLRKNLVTNIFKEWKRTGFAWEQYNPDTGRGQRNQHFTGWTSLVVDIMAMPDLEVGSKKHDEL